MKPIPNKSLKHTTIDTHPQEQSEVDYTKWNHPQEQNEPNLKPILTVQHDDLKICRPYSYEMILYSNLILTSQHISYQNIYFCNVPFVYFVAKVSYKDVRNGAQLL